MLLSSVYNLSIFDCIYKTFIVFRQAHPVIGPAIGPAVAGRNKKIHIIIYLCRLIDSAINNGLSSFKLNRSV